MATFWIIVRIILFVMQVVVGLWLAFLFPYRWMKIAAFVVPLILTLTMTFAMIYTRTHYGTLQSILYFLAYIWVGLAFLFFMATLLLIGLYALCSLTHMPLRPLFGWITLGLFAFITLSSLYGGMSKPTLRHIDITIPGAPSFTAALISDTHLGVGVSLDRFEKALSRIQAEKPDVLFVLGDVFEYGSNRKKYAQALAQFETPLGSVGVLGNHEYYMGHQNSVDFYKQAGITLLQNQTVSLPNGVQIIGVNDIKTASVSPEKLDKMLAQTEADRPRILLSHQPLLTEVAAKHQVPLMLSGHTHNGQLFPFNLLVKWKYPYVYGLYSIGPKSQIYVTSGMFYWGIPLRFLAPSEIPIVHINRHA